LIKEISGLVFRESPRNSNKVKNLTTRADLEDNEVNLLFFSRVSILWLFFVDGSSNFNLLNHMIMLVNLRHGLSFSSDEFHQFLITLLDDLDCNFPSCVLVNSKLDFARET
jgi:hypothetical protein